MGPKRPVPLLLDTDYGCGPLWARSGDKFDLTAYDPQTIHVPTSAEFKEFKLGRCHPWAEDRVM